MNNQEAIEVMFNEWKCIDRNDGIHCDRKCETCDLVMDVGIIREAFNMAISALQAQDSPKPTAESVQNVQNEDLISRKAAIDAMGKAQWAKERLMELPSVQPETAKRIVGKSRNGMTLWYQCDMCNEPVDAQDNFCRGCGRRLTDG